MRDSGLPADSTLREVDARQRQSTAGQLGRRLLRILAPTRVRNISLHDAAGELLWLNQGADSPERARHLQAALDAFALDRGLEFLERDVDEANRSLFFCLRTPRGERSGLVHAVVSSRRRPDVNPEQLRERVLAAMRRFSDSALPELPGIPAPTPSPAPLPIAHAQVAPAVVEAAPAPANESQLRLRPYARLCQVGATRRYEVAEQVGTCAEDLGRTRRLIRLVQRRGAQNAPTPASFTLPLCAQSVLTPDYLDQISPWLQEAGVAADMIGFCIPASAWELDPAATEHFIERCGSLHCFVALDDFNLARPGGFALLRFVAVRCLKLDAALTASLMDDKFAQANVAGIAKAARVLRLYCVAKAVRTPAEVRWMRSAGVEFADRLSRAGKGAATTRSARALKVASGA